MNELLPSGVSKMLATDPWRDRLGPKGDVDNVWRMILRSRWQCLFVFALICALAGAFRVVVPSSYKATAIVALSPMQPDLTATDQVIKSDATAGHEPDIQSQIQTMTSEPAVRRVSAILYREFGNSLPAALASLPTAALNQFKESWNSFGEPEAGATIDRVTQRQKEATSTLPLPKVISEEAVLELVKKHLKIEPIEKSTTIGIVFDAHDAEIAARAANLVAENYIESRQTARVEQAKRASTFLRNRSDELLKQVRAAESAVDAYRTANVLDGRDVEQLRAEMDVTNAQLASARIARGTAKAKLDAVEARVRQGGLGAALESGSSRLDDRLKEMAAEAHTRLAGNAAERGLGHPDSRRNEQEYAAAQMEIAREGQARLDRLRSEVAIANEQAQQLEASLRNIRTAYDKLRSAQVQLEDLERQAKASRAVYETVLNRLKLTEQVGFNEAQNWIISPAVPPAKASSPNNIFFAGITLLLAACGSLGLALVTAAKSSGTIVSLQQINERGLRALGIVPDLGLRGRSLAKALTAGKGRTAFSEAVTSIVASVMELTRHSDVSPVLLVTSSMPFEGKSTTAAVLSARIASMGKRVLLIDADLRAPRLHHAFGLTTERGLTECLDRDLTDAIQIDAQTGISVLAAGPLHLEPQNILRSARLVEAIEAWRASYDFILIDSPPILPISDARILAPLADYCIFVAHWRDTRWSVASHAMALLREAGGRLAGVVLSQVNIKQMTTYGYADSQTYGRAYSRYSARRSYASHIGRWANLARDWCLSGKKTQSVVRHKVGS
jgi:polysaccharide biosynthesis transport protein